MRPLVDLQGVDLTKTHVLIFFTVETCQIDKLSKHWILFDKETYWLSFAQFNILVAQNPKHIIYWTRIIVQDTLVLPKVIRKL